MQRFFMLFALLMIFNLNLSYADDAECKVIVVKNDAWSKYNVNVALRDFLTQQPIITLHLPGASENKTSLNMSSAVFSCDNFKQIQFFATFSPPIWENEVNAIYSSSVIWDITKQVKALKPGFNQVQVEVKFPEDFVNVPLLVNTKLFQ